MTGLSATFLISYLLGSVSFAILVSRLRGLGDPRSYGSGNPGATNMLRTGDKRAAALTLIGDAAKGWLAIMVFHALLLPGAASVEEANEWLAVAAIAVFLGHLFPVFFQFKGGKGVATALGVLLGLSPLLGVASLVVWLVVFGLSRISRLCPPPPNVTSTYTPSGFIFKASTVSLSNTAVWYTEVCIILQRRLNLRPSHAQPGQQRRRNQFASFPHNRPLTTAQFYCRWPQKSYRY